MIYKWARIKHKNKTSSYTKTEPVFYDVWQLFQQTFIQTNFKIPQYFSAILVFTDNKNSFCFIRALGAILK